MKKLIQSSMLVILLSLCTSSYASNDNASREIIEIEAVEEISLIPRIGSPKSIVSACNQIERERENLYQRPYGSLRELNSRRQRRNTEGRRSPTALDILISFNIENRQNQNLTDTK